MTIPQHGDRGGPKPVKPRLVWMDPYALTDIARTLRLSTPELATLTVLVLHADWRSQEWAGTLGSLAEFTRLARNTQPKAVRGLASRGLIEVVTPFKQGGEGRILISAYCVLVNPGNCKPVLSIVPDDSDDEPEIAQICAIEEEGDCATVAQNCVIDCATVAQDCVIDLGKQGVPKDEPLQRGVGLPETKEMLDSDGDPPCRNCRTPTPLPSGFCSNCEPF